MLSIAYRFHVHPRHHGHFLYAYQAARESLQHTLGLNSHQLDLPTAANGRFELVLDWDAQSSFERFTRTWLGVWLLNGLGLEREAFLSPIETVVGAEDYAPHAGKRAA